MTIPAAPLEGNGAKILFGVYNNAGANAAALIHAIVTRTLNSETIGFIGMATHADLATFVAGDPVVLAAGYDGTLARKRLVDTAGRGAVVGASAVGAAVAGNPVLVGGSDGTNARYVLLDTSGRQLVAGEVVDNAGFTDGTTRVVPAGFIFDEVAGTALTENDAGASRMDSKRAQIGVLEDATTRGQRAAVDAQGAQLVKEKRSATPGQTSVGGSASSVTVLASNANRLGATVFNDSAAVLYLKLGATASTSSFTIKMAADGYYEVPFGYTGVVDGIWASATGNARITELTA